MVRGGGALCVVALVVVDRMLRWGQAEGQVQGMRGPPYDNNNNNNININNNNTIYNTQDKGEAELAGVPDIPAGHLTEAL